MIDFSTFKRDQAMLSSRPLINAQETPKLYLARVAAMKALLEETEKAHAATGEPAKFWAAWYAAYLVQHGVKR